MHDRIMTGFCPLLWARMSLLAAAYKKYTILMLLAKRRLWKLKLKIILYTPKMSLFTECFNKKSSVCTGFIAPVSIPKENTPDSLTNP